MLSEYFITKTKTNKFKERLETLINTIKDGSCYQMRLS